MVLEGIKCICFVDVSILCTSEFLYEIISYQREVDKEKFIAVASFFQDVQFYVNRHSDSMRN